MKMLETKNDSDIAITPRIGRSQLISFIVDVASENSAEHLCISCNCPLARSIAQLNSRRNKDLMGSVPVPHSAREIHVNKNHLSSVFGDRNAA